MFVSSCLGFILGSRGRLRSRMEVEGFRCMSPQEVSFLEFLKILGGAEVSGHRGKVYPFLDDPRESTRPAYEP